MSPGDAGRGREGRDRPAGGVAVNLASSSLPATPRSVVVVLDDEAVAQGLTDLRSRLSDVLSRGDARLVVDVSGLDRISSSVVAALLWAKRKCVARGVDVVVRGSAGQSLGLLTRTGLSAVLDVEGEGGR
jgi:anti-anti-sigma regulatory factor